MKGNNALNCRSFSTGSRLHLCFLHLDPLGFERGSEWPSPRPGSHHLLNLLGFVLRALDLLVLSQKGSESRYYDRGTHWDPVEVLTGVHSEIPAASLGGVKRSYNV